MTISLRVFGVVAGIVLLLFVCAALCIVAWLVKHRLHEYEVVFGACAVPLLLYIAYIALLTVYQCARG